MRYSKPSLSPEKQLAFLKRKGLAVDDDNRVLRYLANIGLFRLKPYREQYYRPGGDEFNPDVNFNDILRLYVFDRKLRVLCFDALERIEVATRSVISNVMSDYCGSHWYIDENNFVPQYRGDRHKSFLSLVAYCSGKDDVCRRNPSCHQYYTKYIDPELPPSWVVIEVLNMSQWSIVYSNIRKTKYKKKISDHFSFDHSDLGAWIHALSVIRNICAHHDILWNRPLQPIATSVEKYTHPGIPLIKPYTNFAMIFAFLCQFVNGSNWSEKLFNILDEHESTIDIPASMGFPVGWYELDFWRLNI